MNTFDMDDAGARAAIDAAEADTGLPCADVVRYDPAPLVNAIIDFDRARRKA
jgi:uncharacterized NAD-dependent epimerase/dehydratase family protein